MVVARRSFLAATAGLGLAALAGCGERKPFAAVGKPFPGFRQVDIDGRLVDSAVYAGQPLVLNFWATWCPPCRSEMPDLEIVHRGYAARGMRVFGFSIDDDANPVREFRLRTGVSFPLLIDAGRKFATALGVTSFPTTFLVARDGRVTEVLVGPRPWPEYPGIAALL
jgi:peroxiredoxin